MNSAALTEADVTWTEDRVIALMQGGLRFVDAVELAARQCTARVLEREAARVERRIVAVEAERDRRRDERRRREDEDYARRRAELEARGTPAQRPTLKASLGDLLAAKGVQRP